MTSEEREEAAKKPAMTARIEAAIRAWKTARVRAEEAAKAGETSQAVMAELDAAAAAWGDVEKALYSQALATISIEEFQKVAGNEDALAVLLGRKMAAVIGRPDLPDYWYYSNEKFVENVLRRYVADENGKPVWKAP